MKTNTIDMQKFLLCYLNISNENLKDITHKEVKTLMPYLKRCSFEYAEEHPELVEAGEIIYVNDRLHNIVPYLRPELMIKPESDEVVIDKIDKPIQDEFNLDGKSVYELRELLHRTKRISQLKQIKKELELQGFKKQKSKKKKFKEEYYD